MFLFSNEENIGTIEAHMEEQRTQPTRMSHTTCKKHNVYVKKKV